MCETCEIRKLSELLYRIKHSESLVQRAEAFYERCHHDWSREARGHFLDVIERKKDQIAYEWDQVFRMGTAIASGRDPHQPDI